MCKDGVSTFSIGIFISFVVKNEVGIGMSMESCCLRIRRQRLGIDIYMASCHLIARQRHGIDIKFLS